MAEFHATSKIRQGALVLELVGDITGRSAEPLLLEHDRAMAGHAGPLVLNFTATDYINSSGIAVIVTILAQARRDGRVVRAVGLTEHYRHVFDLTRLSDFLDFYVTEDAAVAGAGIVASRDGRR